MSDMLQIVLHAVQGIALWAVFSRRIAMRNSTEQYFLYYISYIVLNEIIAKVLTNTNLGNYIVYNMYDVVTYLFFIYWFYTLLNKKVWILILGIMYLIGLSYNIFFTEESILGLLTMNVYVGTFVILILSVSYFASLLQSKEAINYIELPAFWITTGLLIFQIGYLPIHYILKIDSFNPTVLYASITLLNILQYGFFTKGFLCYKKEM
jgi:hypothetical protein